MEEWVVAVDAADVQNPSNAILLKKKKVNKLHNY